MANTNIETEEVKTGVRLTVIVEYSCENIIAVYLVHNGKEYRGVLLETDSGFFPHGIPYSSKQMVEQKAIVKSSPRSALDVKPGMENKPPDLNSCKDVKFELSASLCRFSYNTNPFLMNPRPVPETPIVEMKSVTIRRKTVRDIRLRPRQTLCFKCKAAIHDNHKNNISQGNSHSTVTSAASKLIPPSTSTCRNSTDAVPHSTPTLPPVTRKRKKSLQSPMVLLEDIQLKSNKISQERNSKELCNTSDSPPLQRSSRGVKRSSSGNKLSDFNRKPVNAKARSHRSSSSGSNNTGNDFLQIIDDSESNKGNSVSKSSKKKCIISTACNAKPSPAIKITIGDGAIIKIPPRLPDRGADLNNDELPIPKLKILDSGPVEYHAHKKAKKAAKKAKDREKCKSSASKGESFTDLTQDEVVPSKSQKKHKKKHRHRHESPIPLHAYSQDAVHVPSVQKKIRDNNDVVLPVSDEEELESNGVIVDSISVCRDAENYENTVPVVDNISKPRPRLVYTWRQNQGLSRVSSSPRESAPSVSPKYLIKNSPSIIPIGNSPHRRKNASPARVVSASPNWHFAPSPKRMLKEYPLRSMNDSAYSSGRISDPVQSSDYGIVETSEDSQSHSSEAESHLSDFSDDSGDDCIDDFFPGPQSPPREDEDKDIIKPLMMKIQTQNVDGCVLEEGREIRVGDIVWGKIQGFPWWPGRVSNITVTQRDNDVVITQVANVAWFGSNTVSHMHCSDLFPFLEDFKARYNKKKKGQYRLAIKQATSAAQRLAAESHREFLIEDYEL